MRSSLAMTAGVALLLGAAFLPPASRSQTSAAAPSAAEQNAFFTKEVWPVLQSNCVPCHSGEAASGGLNLTTRAALLKGGASGPSVVPGDLTKSLLTRAVHFEGRQMPPQGKLPLDKIAILDRWVKMGAPWPNARPAPGGAKSEPAHHGPPQVNAKNMRFWSFQKVKRPTPPAVKNAAWVRNPIDTFVLAKLEKNGLKPAAPANRAALIRRAYYDMTGLPPSPAEVSAFLADTSPNAWEKVIDHLLASPQYGERWGRHWLDQVRYAETNSFERDGDKPFVWRYRDYVIRAFNSDKPYDRFIKEQLAGDELPGFNPDALIATGYYRLGLWDDEPADPELARYDELDDIASTTGQTFLGLTVGCARCHDHKIDPFPQKDYYRMLAFFRGINRYGERSGESVREFSMRPISPLPEQARYAAESKVHRGKLKELDKQIEALEDLVKPHLGGGEVDDFKYDENRPGLVKKYASKALTTEQFTQYESLEAERKRQRENPPKGLEMALCVTEAGPTPPKSFVMLRGNAHAEGDPVTPGFPSILAPPEPKIPTPKPGAKSSGRRLALAQWIASPDNPLTARVMANRVWQFHFGRGIVRTPSNFGFLGTAPTHPELLDYLASELVRGGWRLKPLHRQILLSSTYRMSSKADPKALAKDPENDLLWRFDMRRLSAEEIRDSMLAVGGSLNRQMYGPSITVELPAEVLAGQSMPGQGWPKSPADQQARRSIYVKSKRSLAVPILARFDAPETDATCPVRFSTTQPTQALGMMNSAFSSEQSRIFADKVTQRLGATATPEAQVTFALWQVMQRAPSAAEVSRGVALMRDLKTKDGKTDREALEAFCLVALNLNEFVYLD